MYRLIVLLATSIPLLTGCSWGYKNFGQDQGQLKGPDRFVLQVDDYGNFWDSKIADEALKHIERESAKTNTVVTVFAHGWHHNAAPDNKNALNFARSLDSVTKILGEDVYKKSRAHLTEDPSIRIIGIYIGWRGESLPGLLDYLTFWGRKEVAERVGSGDVREFLLRLQAIYVGRNRPVEDPKLVRPFMGLVVIGHSFGGQVVFQAVAQTMENELVRATTTHQGKQPLSGFGDLVVLLNPALEAHQFHRIDSLSKKLEFMRDQPPLMLVLSADTDAARNVFFPIGRNLEVLFDPPFREGQRELWTQALGAYLPQVTHELDITNQKYEPFDPKKYTQAPCEIVDFDLTNVPNFAGVRLLPTVNHKQFGPFVVANTSFEVIRRHSGIFLRAEQEDSALQRFLTNYVALAQGKRILLARGYGRTCPAEE